MSRRRPRITYLLLAITIGTAAVYTFVTRSRERGRLEFEQVQKNRIRLLRTIHRSEQITEFLNDYHAELGHFPSPEGGATSETLLALTHDIGISARLSESPAIEWWLQNHKTTDYMWYDPYSREEDDPFHYISNGEAYSIVGRGPDGEFSFHVLSQITASILNQEYIVAKNISEINFYDPTNGTFSAGDIYVTSDNIELSISSLWSRFSDNRQNSWTGTR